MEGLLKHAEERNKFGKYVVYQDQGSRPDSVDIHMREQPDATQQVCTNLTLPSDLGEQKFSNRSIVTLPLPAQFRKVGKSCDQFGPVIWEPFSQQHLSNAWKGSLVRDVFSRRVFRELPSKSVALVLIDEAFKSFNSTYPIFDQRRFIRYFQMHYSDTGPSDAGQWACINVVLALAHRFRAMRTLEASTENEQACSYMQNALAVVSELTMQHNSLPAVQALLGMTIVLEGTPNPRLCSVLNSTALRLAQTMGLHRRNQDPTLTLSEIEERKNVFWIAYFLDRDISLRTGQPPVQDDDDMDVDLPTGTISNLPGNGLDTINFFNSRIGLGIIQGQIYKKLYSVKAARQSESQQIIAVQELDSMLASWRRSVPIDFDDDFITTLQPPIATEILHAIILRFSYVNCLITVHRPFPSATNFANDATLGARNTASGVESKCIVEARKAIRLIRITPRGDYASAWLLIHHFFAAVTALLHHVLMNPTYAEALSDLYLIRPFLKLLEILAGEKKSDEVARMYEFCIDLNRRAIGAVEEVSKTFTCNTVKLDNMRRNTESVEEFIQRVECISAGWSDAAARSFALTEGLDSMGQAWEWDGAMATVEGSGDFDI